MKCGLLLLYVGAGLPAMQTPWSLGDTEVMQSQASQLPHKARFHRWIGVLRRVIGSLWGTGSARSDPTRRSP
ncbi:MAG TPA: hypothetical protein DIW86_07730 [Pseudomonas sp.]|nr:hypothetical protein [Pseudomonas sp.]